MKDDGGSAFPCQPIVHMPDGAQMVTNQGGMSLRDYFAAAALAFLDRSSNPAGIAESAYTLADAMLAERTK